MVEGIVKGKELLQRLERAGWKVKLLPFSFRNGLSESDLRIVENAVKKLGSENFKELVFDKVLSAWSQAEKLHGTRIPENANLDVFVLRKFVPPLSRILSNPALKSNGYYLSFLGAAGADRPLSASLTLYKKRFEKGAGLVAKFNFDLFLTRDLKPGVVLGNFQGNTLDGILEFKARFGASPLDFFLASFKKSFPKNQQVLALNVRRHAYRGELKDYIIAASMHGSGKLSDEEEWLFTGHLANLQSGRASAVNEKTRDVVRRVMAEKERIRRDATGMHKAAFKKAGFKVGKSRLWRLK